jgi:hypothetical protein
MRRVELTEAVMSGWTRLDATQRDRFFHAFLRAALRLNALDLRAWLRRRLRTAPLAAPIDLARYAISDADMAALLKKLHLRGGRCRWRDRAVDHPIGTERSRPKARDPIARPGKR